MLEGLVKLVLTLAMLLVIVAWFDLLWALRDVADVWLGDWGHVVLLAAMCGMIILASDIYERVVLRWRQPRK
jgi:hypothetical protein